MIKKFINSKIFSAFTFKDKSKINSNTIESDIKKPKAKYTFYNKTWVVDEEISIMSQNTIGDVKVYGYIIEERFTYDINKKTDWYNVSGKVYIGTTTVNNALISRAKSSTHEFRIKPLYSYNEVEYREYIIKGLLDEKKSDSNYQKKDNLTFLRLSEDVIVESNISNGQKSIKTYKKGWIFIEFKNSYIIIEDYTTRLKYGLYLIGDSYKKLKKVTLDEVSWIKPHLPKEIKKYIKENE